MEATQALELIEKYGMGTVAFAALLFGVYKAGGYMAKWLEKTFELMTATHATLEAIKGNHLTHIEKSTDESAKMLGAQNQILGVHGAKLDQIITQTTKTADKAAETVTKVAEQTAQTAQTAEKVADRVAEVAQAVAGSKP
jgi:methyl-accepting chemotaxis protein